MYTIRRGGVYLVKEPQVRAAVGIGVNRICCSVIDYRVEADLISQITGVNSYSVHSVGRGLAEIDDVVASGCRRRAYSAQAAGRGTSDINADLLVVAPGRIDNAIARGAVDPKAVNAVEVAVEVMQVVVGAAADLDAVLAVMVSVNIVDKIVAAVVDHDTGKTVAAGR